MTKQYLIEQIERVEKIIKEGTKYRFTEKLRNLKFELFGYNNTLTKFKKETLLNYLEELVKEGFELGLLDRTFAY